jgi:hypothetical protein
MGAASLRPKLHRVQSGNAVEGERPANGCSTSTYDSMIRKGFAATSIEELVEAAGITKSGFF